jgi:cytochrome c oxidase cbb3-type subunit 3
MTIQENTNTDQNEPLQDKPFDGIQEGKKSPPAYFNILFYGLIVWGVIFMGYYLMSGWSSHGEFEEKMNAHQQQYSQGK